MIINKVNEENEKKAQLEKIEKMRSNKNKIQDRLMSEHLEPLRNHKVWEWTGNKRAVYKLFFEIFLISHNKNVFF